MDPQREDSPPASSVQGLLDRSLAAFYAGDLVAALRVLDLAPPAGTDSVTVVEQVRLLNQRGTILNAQGFLSGADLEPAVNVLFAAVQLARTTASASTIADALAELGFAYYCRSLCEGKDEYPSALSAFNHALALYKQAGNPCGLAMAVFQIGLVAERYHDQTQALAQYQKAHTVAEQHQCLHALACIEHQLGLHYARVGDKAAALACARRSLSVREQIGFVPFQPFSHLALGRAFKALGNWSAAAEAYLRADSLALALGATRARLFVALAQGALHEEQGHRAAARQAYQQARAWADSLGDAAAQARIAERLEALGPA